MGRHASRVKGYARGAGRVPGGHAWPTRSRRRATGQVRALITVAGNPVLSTPDSDRLDAALRPTRLHGQRRHLPQRDHPAAPT